MRKQGLFIFIFLIAVLNAFTQPLNGIWEGKLAFNSGKVKTMSVRLELIEDGEMLAGVLYMRGYNQKISFGCDYIVKNSTRAGKKIILEQIKVVRTVATGKEDCAQMGILDLSYTVKDSVPVLKGFFVWLGGAADKISFTKTDTVISVSGEEDMNSYMEERAEVFDLGKIFQPVYERYNKKVMDITIDSSDIVLEFTAADSINTHDSISVYLNDAVISNKHSLKSTLVIRVKELVDPVNSILVVNESFIKRNLRINVRIRYGADTITRTIEPGFSRNSLFVFRRQ